MVRSRVAELVKCRECGTVVAVNQSPGVAFRVERAPAAAERERMTITVDHALVHACVRSLDGTWRVAS
jgi:hypothetical protein